jgi:hypothetical protein
MVSPLVPAIVTVSLLLGMPGLSTGWSPASAPSLAELWQAPADVSAQNVVDGGWGSENAPNPTDIYTFVRDKKPSAGSSPGLVVTDSRGRRWHVKQGREASPEVVVSRVLSAVGYHQPPVYFLPSFTVAQGREIRTARGGRFRLTHDGLTSRGQWAWEENPFVGTQPYQGLLVILVLLNSADLKNSNNTIYDLQTPKGGVARWFVVRDLGTALGEVGRFDPTPNNPTHFDRKPFIAGVRNGFVDFGYHAVHASLVRERITPDDVRWASGLLSGLTDRQWHDIFRTAGYGAADADRFIRRVTQKIQEGMRLGADPRLSVGGDRHRDGR